MQDSHAPFAITRNQRSLDGSLRLPRRPRADASLDRRLSESEFHRRSFLFLFVVIIAVIFIIVNATALTVVGSLAFLCCKG